MSDLKKENFDPHLNGKFKMKLEGGHDLEVELIDITEKNTDDSERFSLVFKGPKDKPVGQRIYEMNHDKMGDMSIFLVPITYGKPDAMYYEAVFNRLKEK